MNRQRRRAAGKTAKPATPPQPAVTVEQRLAALMAEAQAHQQAQRLEPAVTLYRQALALAPQLPEALNNLGLALKSLGRIDESIASLRQAAHLRPDLAQIQTNLGTALATAGLTDEAIACYQLSLRLLPDEPRTLANLCMLLLQRSGQAAAVVALCRDTLSRQPAISEAWFHLGNGLKQMGRLAEARDAFQHSLRLRPDYPEAALNLGTTLQRLGQTGDSLGVLEDLLRRHPDFAIAQANLGSVLQELGRVDAALAAFRQAVRLDPGFSGHHCNLGTLLEDLGSAAEALAAYEQALVLDPANPVARFHRSLTLLRDGRLREGWAEYETRFAAKGLPMLGAALGPPRWDGQPLEGRSLLLLAEQGFGDSLQFIRFATALKARGARVIACLPAALLRLLRQTPGLDAVVAEGSPLPRCDFHLPLLSLPHRLGLTLDDLPFQTAYLHPPAESLERWRGRLDGLPGRKLGLVWSGAPRQEHRDAHLVDRRRSLPLSAFGFLAEIPGLSLVNLQKGPPAAQLAEAPPGLHFCDPMPECIDFADTAALIADLDLVLTVDTAVAHLAGGLGKPVWILSRFDGCWRWFSGRDDSPWYPTARLYRQPAPNAWTPPLEQVARDLRAWVAQG